MAHAFSDSAIKEMERYILANIRTFCDQIGAGLRSDEKGWTTAKSMSDWLSWLSMDILGDLCFGKAFHMLERPDNRFAIDLVSTAAHRHLIVSLLPLRNIPQLELRSTLMAEFRILVWHDAYSQHIVSGSSTLPEHRRGPSSIHGLLAGTVDRAHKAGR